MCNKPDWCQRSDDGQIAKCLRIEAGSFSRGRDGGGEYYLHRVGGAVSRPVPVHVTTTVERADVQTRHAVYSLLLDSLTLSERHASALRIRGISEEAVTRNLYSTMDPAAVAVVMHDLERNHDLATVPGFVRTRDGWVIAARAGELLIPVRDHRRRILALRRRTDQPGSSRYRWLSTPRCGSGAPVHHADPFNASFRPVLLVTEGELKADAIADQLSLTCISLPGVAALPNAFGQTLLECYPAVESVVVAVDSDFRTNDIVRAALMRLVDHLETAFPCVRVLVWDSSFGKGLDDILAGVLR